MNWKTSTNEKHKYFSKEKLALVENENTSSLMNIAQEDDSQILNFHNGNIVNRCIYCHSAISIKYIDLKGILVILVLFYKIQKKNYLMMNIGKYFSSSKNAIAVTFLRKPQILKKPKKQHQVAVTATMMFLKKTWTLQAGEVFFLIA